jgi:predicted  nucleic acid-binding Zn-ribbon protein
MQCFKCQHKWQNSRKNTIGLCPGCGTDLLKSLADNPKEIDTEYKLQYIIECFGYDVLQHRYIIYGIIHDLFAHDKRLVQVIITSIKLKIPDKITDIKHNTDKYISQDSLKEYLLNKSSMSDLEAEEIIYDWLFAIPIPRRTVQDGFEEIWALVDLL